MPGRGLWDGRCGLADHVPIASWQPVAVEQVGRALGRSPSVAPKALGATMRADLMGLRPALQVADSMVRKLSA